MGRRGLGGRSRGEFKPRRLARELRYTRFTPEEQLKLRMEIIARHARLHSNGRPVCCFPSPTSEDRHSEGKVIFDTRQAALAAEREMRALDGVRQWVYECDRSRHGHCHLTSRRR